MWNFNKSALLVLNWLPLHNEKGTNVNNQPWSALVDYVKKHHGRCLSFVHMQCSFCLSQYVPVKKRPVKKCPIGSRKGKSRKVWSRKGLSRNVDQEKSVKKRPIKKCPWFSFLIFALFSNYGEMVISSALVRFGYLQPNPWSQSVG